MAAASSWTAAIAACSWYGPAAPRGSAASSSAVPSAICSRSHLARSCSASGISDPSGPSAGGPPRVGQQHQRQQAGHLAVLRQQPVQPAGEPDRLPDSAGPVSSSPSLVRVALVEDQVQHVQHGAAAARSAPPRPGCSKSDPAWLIVCLARLIRWAMVASGTPNAAAICAVDRPPTARRVSAIWLGDDSAGWQQPNSRASESSRSAGPASAGGPSSSAAGWPPRSGPPGSAGTARCGPGRSGGARRP